MQKRATKSDTSGHCLPGRRKMKVAEEGESLSGVDPASDSDTAPSGPEGGARVEEEAAET